MKSLFFWYSNSIDNQGGVTFVLRKVRRAMKNKGTLLGIGAYVLWGLITLYWKLIQGVSPLETICYRIIWSFVFMILFLFISGKWSSFIDELKELLKNKKQTFLIVLAAILISINWFTFIYTVYKFCSPN